MSGNRELAERFISALEARDWDAWAGLLHPDVLYEIPQSRERIRGRDRYLQFNREYAGDWHLRPKVTIADERHAVVWFEWLLDGRTDDAMAFFELADGLITRVTDFWPEPYEAPPGREHLTERWLPVGLLAVLTCPRTMNAICEHVASQYRTAARAARRASDCALNDQRRILRPTIMPGREFRELTAASFVSGASQVSVGSAKYSVLTGRLLSFSNS